MNSSFHVEPELGIFPPIYIHSETRIVVKIVNNRDKFLNYEFRKLPNQSEEQQLLDYFDHYDPEERKRATNLLLFESRSFQIENLTGVIYPHGSQQIIITYKPQEAAVHEEKLYLIDTESGERFPFSLRGVGIPPKASLSAEMINCGHVALDMSYEYQIYLKNSGEIPLSFQIKNDRERDLNYSFTPQSGIVNPDENLPITIRVEATKVGQFYEKFEVNIDECPINALQFIISGRVIGPSFEINPKRINFGTVSYGFVYTQMFDIKNTSDIPLDFSIAVPQDPTFDKRVFSVFPDFGTVQPQNKMTVKLEFLPNILKDYNAEMVISNPKYEHPLVTIPITGTCICPNIIVSTPDVNIGDFYIGHRGIVKVTLQNQSMFPGKYEYIDIDDPSMLDYDFEIDQPTGVIPARSKTDIVFFLTARQIGPFSFTRHIKIIGSGKRTFSIHGISTGPTIVFDPPNIDFQTINVLQETTQILTVSNKSPIPAPYSIELKSDVFWVETSRSTINPYDQHQIVVHANVNDCLKFSSELFFVFNYLTPITIPVTAKGTGYPIVPSIDLSEIELGHSFIADAVTREFTLVNNGRRNFEIKWEGKNQKETKNAPSLQIMPEQRVMFPGDEILFTINVNSKKPMNYNIPLTCILSIGKKKVNLFKPVIKGTFIQPIVEFENNELVFEYKHDCAREEELTGPQTQGNSSVLMQPSKELMEKITKETYFILRCESAIKLTASTEYPFEITPMEFVAIPDVPTKFWVTFDPSVKTNFLNEAIKSQIFFSYSFNAEKLHIDLVGKLMFANITFNNVTNSTIDFGTKIEDSENQTLVSMSNNGEVVVEYEWTLLKTGPDDGKKNVFDIFPIRGKLYPNSTELISVSFKALSDEHQTSHFATALCHVIGGPDYTFTLKGNATPLKYKVSPTEIDFGKRLYNDNLTTAIVIENMSMIDLPYKIQIPRKMKFSSLTIDPQKDVIPPNSIRTINVAIMPGSPANYKEYVYLKIDQFDEIEICFTVECSFSQLKLEIPRSDKDILLKQQAKNKVEKPLESIEKELFIQNINQRECSPIKQRVMMSRKGLRQFQGNYLSHFIIDFGQIILGQSLTKSYNFTSLSPLPSSFELLDDVLQNSGFSFATKTFSQLYQNERYCIEVNFNTSPNLKKIGKVLYEIPLIFPDENAYLIEIRGYIKIPTLTYSSLNLDFEETIVGQSRTKTIQIRNMNPVPIEMYLQNAVPTSPLERQVLKESPFTSDIQKVTFEPYSFLNVNIKFTPIFERTFAFQFGIHIPLNAPYVNNIDHIQCTGSSVDMKITFEPQQINFKPINAFSDEFPETEFKMVNNNKYPITIISNQYDFQLLQEQIQITPPSLLESPSQNSSSAKLNVNISEESLNINVEPIIDNTPRQLPICVIIHGVPKSGKTTLCKKVSEYLDLPLLCPKSIFEGKSDVNECKNLLSEIIKMPSFARGMIIDGLDGFDDPPETEPFITQTLKKEKKLHEELAKNPFLALPHQFLTGSEQMLDLLLSIMPESRFFAIFMNTNQEALTRNEMVATVEQQRQEEEKRRNEKERFFNMDEEEYLALPKDEQQRVDTARAKYRSELLQLPNTEIRSQPTSARLALNRNIKAQPTNAKIGLKKSNAQKEGNNYILFLGSLAQKLREKESIAIDPLVLVPNDKCTDPHNVNCIFVDANDDEAFQRVTYFLPPYKDFVKKLMDLQIPGPKLILPSDLIENDKLRLEDSPLYFSLVNSELPYSIKEEPKESTKDVSKRIRGSRRQERDPPPQVGYEQLYEGINLMNYTKRWELNPGESVTLKVNFTGQAIGEYTDSLRFSILDASNYVFSIGLAGKVVYPDIDRSNESIFSRIVPKYNTKIKSSFIIETNEFNFGCILSQLGKIGGKGFVPAFKQSFRLFNPGTLPCEISALLTETNSKTVQWAIEQKSITVKPQEESNVSITVHPIAPDVIHNKLQLYIKNNPEPISIPIVADVCVPQLTFSTLSVDFDKILIGTEKTIRISVTNSGKVPASFSLKGANSLSENIKFTNDSGKLQCGQSMTFGIVFSSVKAVIVKKSLDISIMEENAEKVYSVMHMNINAEAYETLYDFTKPKDIRDGNIDFGTLRVKGKKDITCYLKNKGKYPLSYSVEIRKKVPFVTVSVTEGVINSGDKPLPIVFSFNPQKQIKITKKELCIIKITDATSNTQTTSFTLTVSGESVFSVFDITPQQLLDFGPCITGNNYTRNLEISNNGYFPFDWEILLNNEQEEKESNNGKGKAKKKPPPKKGKAKLTIGQFTIMNNTGTIEPNSKESIAIEFTSPQDGSYSNNFYIKISNVPDNLSFINYNLSAKTFTPIADLKNCDDVFGEFRICAREDLTRKESTSFLEDENCVHFTNIKVGGTEKVIVNVPNHLPVPCVVIPSLTQLNTPFTISKNEIEIPALSKIPIELAFSPTQGGDFKNTLMFKMKAKEKQKEPVPVLAQYQIEGSATVPAIEFEDNLEAHNFGRTLLSMKKEKIVKFKNITDIPLNVRMKYDKNKNFTIEELPVNEILPDNELQFKVTFNPIDDGEKKLELMILIENIHIYRINFSGEGHHEELVIDADSFEEDTILFDDVVVDQTSSKMMYMRNMSNEYIKYDWNIQHSDLIFSPSMGHIPPKTTEQIRISFKSEKPQKINTKAICQWSKIHRETTERWNDNIIVKRFDIAQPPTPVGNRKSPRNSNRRKIQASPSQTFIQTADIAPEPEYKTIAKGKDIPVKINIFCDNIKVVTSLSDNLKEKENCNAINFSSTMMYETRVTNLYLINQSNIKISYELKFSNYECGGFSDSPFSVHPKQGYIPSNSSIPLTVYFSPLSVDDYSIDMTIKLPDVNENQTIKISGTSIRPICHIDALNAKDLPGGRKSITIFSEAVGTMAPVKFGIRNTTNCIYEAKIYQVDGPRCIKCLTPSPVIGSGRRYELAFEFTPKTTRATETTWVIDIPEYSLKQTLIIVGHVCPK